MTRSTFENIQGSLHRPPCRTSSINHPDAKLSGPTCRDFRSSRKNGNALWKLPHLWKSMIGGLRQLLLGDFHRCLEKSLAKTLGLFHSYTQRQRRLTYSIGEKMRFLVDRSHPTLEMISTPASLRSDHWMPSSGIGGGLQLESLAGFPGIRNRLSSPW